MPYIIDQGRYELRCGSMNDYPEVVELVQSSDAQDSPTFQLFTDDNLVKQLRHIDFNESSSTSATAVRKKRQTTPIHYEGGILASLPIDPLPSYIEISRLCQHYFEVAAAPHVSLCFSPLLASLAHGRRSSLVCDLGYTSARVSKVQEAVVQHGYTKSSQSISGHAVDKLILRNVDKVSADPTNLHFIKKKLCTMKKGTTLEPNVNSHVSSPDCCEQQNCALQLPDGNKICYPCGLGQSIRELYFSHTSSKMSPARKGIDLEALSLTELIRLGMSDTPSELNLETSPSIVVCGGGSAIRGMIPRLRFELQAPWTPSFLTRGAFRGNESIQFRPDIFCDSLHPEYTVWTGGSIASQLKTFISYQVSRLEYMEHGPDIVHRRCLC